MNYLKLFRMPTPMKITGRSSSITNAFINSIILVIMPTEKEVKEALSVLEMDKDNFQCAYCGATASEWDHLRPLVLDKKPTGYISEIQNLVPSCGKCNQSKGNKDWDIWMFSEAKLSPKSRGILNLDERKNRLTAYEQWKTPTKIDNFEEIVGKALWQKHMVNCEHIQDSMRDAQDTADKIKKKIMHTYKPRRANQ